MTVAFELDGRAFTALNGGPMFTFNEAISLQVSCETQEEVGSCPTWSATPIQRSPREPWKRCFA
jgi:predicted 3-demethylubiquinone-9 3-methyltransferase (glyoxalase superfamily)